MTLTKLCNWRALALAWPAVASAQWLDFAQLDKSAESTTLVLVRALKELAPESAPPPLLSASGTRWSTGEAASLGYTQRFATTDGPHRLVFGGGASVNRYRSRDPQTTDRGESGLALRAQAELSGPALAGSYYTLLQASTFRRSWFATAQYAPDAQRFGVELSRYHETGWQATSAVLRVSVVPRWFVRIGLQRATGETRPFFGVAYNGF
ncbi:MAG TPA: hypothetical protein VFP68_14475 [Burkholderiaceae bacterium]|nr:hypothetical protein [Burkholderiaceae bacterium]